MRGWKQPIPTNMEHEFGDDTPAYVLFIFLILRSCNSSTTIKIGRKYIPIKRGQVVFGRNSWCKYLNMSPSGVERVLNRLKVTGKVTCKTNKNCTIVTIKNYDALTLLEQEVNKKRTRSEQEANTSKSVKNVKNVKNVYIPKQKNKYTSIKKIKPNLIRKIAEDYHVDMAFVENVLDSMKLWCGATGRVYKDYNLALRSWVKRDIAASKKRGGAFNAKTRG